MDSSKIDMSLEDIIKMNKPTGARGGLSRGTSRGRWNSSRGGGGGRGGGLRSGGAFRQERGRVTRPDSGQGRPQWSRFFNAGSRPESGSASGAKLLISNLDFGVSDEDIKELFGEFGPMKKAAVHYDRSGRSMGTAEVIYERGGSAQKAVSQYNGVPLDGRSMNIQVVSANGAAASTNASSGPRRSGGFDNRIGGGSYNGRGGGRGGSRGGRGGGGGFRGGGGRSSGGRGGGGRSGGSERREAPTKEELDAELDQYNANME